MRADRKAAREFVKSIKTRADLEAYFSMLNLTEDERTIAMMLFGNGWTRARIAMEVGFSEAYVKKKIARIYDRMV